MPCASQGAQRTKATKDENEDEKGERLNWRGGEGSGEQV